MHPRTALLYRQEQALLDVKAAAEAAKLVLEEDAKRSAEALKAKRSLVQYHFSPFHRYYYLSFSTTFHILLHSLLHFLLLLGASHWSRNSYPSERDWCRD